MATVVHLAAVRGEEDILNKLLAHSRSRGLLELALYARDRSGRMPHHLAAAAGHIKTLKILLKTDRNLIHMKAEVVSLQNIKEEEQDSFLHDHKEVSNLVNIIFLVELK